ncbi:unnamed protein product [Phaedon cochleariae]|uniref:Uncharacterized protein n=1 Tax=Phaedon cochleariae TaxID=80249 RepID=A0A9N9SMT9_PHACE|nr:unnamed protein product [Phaedon cochleariae]
MTLNHSKTWPVSTLAVVQLRVDPQGKTYTNVDDENRHEKTAEQAIREKSPLITEHRQKDIKDDAEEINGYGGGVVPLSKKHLELFTKMSSVPRIRTTVRTDTVSTILDTTEFELERIEESGELGRPEPTPDDVIVGPEVPVHSPLQKFHVLALTRIDESIDEAALGGSGKECHVGRRPSVRVDNWDFIYTETLPDAQIHCPVHHYTLSPPASTHLKNSLLPPELPLDARKTTTLRRHYYPESGWGWVVVVCAVLVHVLNHGIQLGCSQLVIPGAKKFKVETVHFAGE